MDKNYRYFRMDSENLFFYSLIFKENGDNLLIDISRKNFTKAHNSSCYGKDWFHPAPLSPTLFNFKILSMITIGFSLICALAYFQPNLMPIIMTLLLGIVFISMLMHFISRLFIFRLKLNKYRKASDIFFIEVLRSILNEKI